MRCPYEEGPSLEAIKLHEQNQELLSKISLLEDSLKFARESVCIRDLALKLATDNPQFYMQKAIEQIVLQKNE